MFDESESNATVQIEDLTWAMLSFDPDTKFYSATVNGVDVVWNLPTTVSDAEVINSALHAYKQRLLFLHSQQVHEVNERVDNGEG